MSLDVELKVSDIQERYRTLLMYELEVKVPVLNLFLTLNCFGIFKKGKRINGFLCMIHCG